MAVSNRGEQRKHQRVLFDGPVRVNGSHARGVDLSVGGIRVRQLHPTLEIDSIVIVDFILPGVGPFATRALVHHADDDSCVLRFLRLDPRTMLTLLNYTSAETQAA